MRYQYILALGVLVVLCACTVHPPPTPDSLVGRATSGDFIVEIWASKLCTFSDDPVIVRGTITNVGIQTRTIDLGDKIVFDLIIADPTGEYRWSDGKPLAPELTRLELGPQETKTLEMQWKVPQNGSPGFLATAQFIDHPKYTDSPVKVSVRVHGPDCPFGH